MSLRREIHSAFDSIAPSTAYVPGRVIDTLLAEDAGRRRKERIMLRLRAPLSFVAAVIVIALVAAILVGGRMIADLRSGTNPVPVGQPHSQGPVPLHPGWPAGNPVPLQLQGDWYMLASESQALAGTCTPPLTNTSCMFKLHLTGTTYQWFTNVPGYDPGTAGNVVVNGSEIDFFNGPQCFIKLPAGVGHYRWTLDASDTLSFKELNADSCPRGPWLKDQTYVRTG